MKTTLDPVTRDRLVAFGRRRRRLILLRGGCALLIALLVSMSLVGLADWKLLLSDEVRTALSAAAYLAVAAAVWWTCIRLLLRAPDARELARLLEQAEPQLREDLLSAVELGDERFGWRGESDAFNRLLQTDVARRIRDVQAARVLSLRRIRAWLLAGAGVVAAAAALLWVPGFPYDRLLLRSLLPLANLERVSRVRVTILEPNPADTVVPRGEPATLLIAVAGADVESASVELFPRGQSRERLPLRAAGSGRFEAALPVGNEPIEYRVRAGDAITRKYLLTPAARPQVLAFEKTAHFPAYTGRPDRTTRDPRGDLSELEGTTIELVLQTDQEIRAGELRLELGGQPSTVPLERAGPRRQRARLPLTASGSYRVHLVAAQTRFDNKYSPQYEIRALPDLVPSVVLLQPDRDLILPPDEILLIEGHATDDVGLRRVAQKIRVNEADAKEETIAEASGTDFKIERRWDLYGLGLRPGDRVVTQLVAVDLKGNRSESVARQITVSAPTFDPDRLLPLAAKEALYEALAQLAKTAAEADRRLTEAAARAAGSELERGQALLRGNADADLLTQQAGAVEERVREALKLAGAGRESYELILVGRLVNRIKEASVADARAAFQQADGSLLARGQQAFKQILERAGGAEQHYRAILAGEEAVAIVNDLTALSVEQSQINRRAAETKLWDALARRQRAAVGQIKSVEDLLQVLAARAPRAAPIRQALSDRRAELEKALAAPPDARLAGPAAAIQQHLLDALNATRGLEQELAGGAVASRAELERRSEPSWTDVRELVQAPSAARWKGVQAQLEARAQMDESRADADRPFVADAGLAARALEAQAKIHEARPDAPEARGKLQIVQDAFRTLETGHRLAELSIALRKLAEAERWESAAPDAVTRHPKNWRWIKERVGGIGEAFKQAALPADAGGVLEKAFSEAPGQQAEAEMARRAPPGRKPEAAWFALEALEAQAQRSIEQIAPAMEEARRKLRELVPTLAQRLEELAKESRELEQQSQQAAAEPETAPAKPAELLAQQQDLNRQIQQVMAELRRDANAQDLFTEEGRQRARDADDATAMLREAPPKAEEALREAAAASEAPRQQQKLQEAARQEAKTAEALETLARHAENMEQGKPEETRPELRAAEEALGLKPELDRRYQEMERLARLAAQESSEELRKALEEALKSNAAMQRELRQLAQNALDRAEQALKEAAAREHQEAENLTQQAQKQQSLAEQAKKIAEQARQMAKKDVPELIKESAAAAKPSLEQAQKDLNEGADRVPQDFSSRPPQELSREMKAAAEELHQAAKGLQEAQKKDQEAAQAAQKSAQEQQQKADAAKKALEEANKRNLEAATAAQGQPDQPQIQQAAKEAAKAANAAREASQKAAEQAKASQKAAQQAQAAEQHAGQEAQQAEGLAQQAEKLAEALGQEAAQAAQRAAEAQQPIGQMTRGAESDIRRAARHEARLGNPEQAQELGRVAEGTQAVAENEIPSAERAAAQQPPAQAAQAATQAERALERQAEALARARESGRPQRPASGEPDGLSEAAAEFMARALDSLDQGQGQPAGQPQPGSEPGREALQSAAQAQAESMAQGRGQQPSARPSSANPAQGGQAVIVSSPGPDGELPPPNPDADLPPLMRVTINKVDWAKLPPKMARDLLEAQRESVAPEYRGMVDSYFRVIAERARQNK
jgi:hypothetical protein